MSNLEYLKSLEVFTQKGYFKELNPKLREFFMTLAGAVGLKEFIGWWGHKDLIYTTIVLTALNSRNYFESLKFDCSKELKFEIYYEPKGLFDGEWLESRVLEFLGKCRG